MRIKIIIILIILIFGTTNFVLAVTENVDISATVLGCGDDTIGVGESCDGADLGGASCVSQGFASGTLTCTSLCAFNTSSCIASSTPAPTSSGGGVILPTTTGVIFSGNTIPLGKVYILKDGQLISTIVADENGNFNTQINGISTGPYTFSVYGENKQKMRSSLLSFPVHLTNSSNTTIDNIVINKDSFILDSYGFSYLRPDINHDRRGNFLDFSIMRIWYKKYAPPAYVELNNDNKVDLVDFSIMGYYWTG